MVDVSTKHRQKLTLASTPTMRVPVRCGVPFAVGTFRPLDSVTLNADGRNIVCQVRPTLYWPTKKSLDKSIQWALVDWIAEPGVDEYELELQHERVDVEEPASDRCPLHYQQTDDCWLQVAKVLARLEVRLAGGGRLRPQLSDRLDIDIGTIRQSVRLAGKLVDDQQEERLLWFLHVHTFADAALQKWSLTFRNPQAALHPGGIWELGDPNSVHLDSLTLFAKHGDSDALANGSIRLSDDLGWDSVATDWRLQQFGSGGENFRSPIHRTANGQVDVPFQGYQTSTCAEGTRSTPAFVIGGDQAAIGFYCDRFWQTFPKSLALAASGELAVGILPADYGNSHELQPGEQFTFDFAIAAGPSGELTKLLDQLRAQPVVKLEPSAVGQANVIPHLATRADDSNRTYLNLIDQAVGIDDSFFEKRERIDQYGWRHFGDVYGDHEAVYARPDSPLVSHYNNQYDLTLGLGIQYLRGGHNRYRQLMQDLARHVIDIDIYHTEKDRDAYNHGLFWHTVHYVDAGLATHRSYPTGTCGGGPSSGHAYARGLLLHYCMTGDETAKEAVLNMGRWMIAAEDGRTTRYKWLARGETGLTTASGSDSYHGPGRGPANAVEVLLAAFELSQDIAYLRQAEHLIRRVSHPNQPVEELNLLDVENRWFYTMFLQALGRYLQTKLTLGEVDATYTYARRVLLRFADWMVVHEYPYLDKPEVLEYPNETWAGQEMRKCEALQWASRFADSERRRRYLDKAKYFFDTSCRQLSASERSSLCRPVALLLTNGYSRAWFQNRTPEDLPLLPPGVDRDFAFHKPFVSQKQRAVQRAKWLAGFAAILVLSLFVLLLGWAISIFT